MNLAAINRQELMETANLDVSILASDPLPQPTAGGESCRRAEDWQRARSSRSRSIGAYKLGLEAEWGAAIGDDGRENIVRTDNEFRWIIKHKIPELLKGDGSRYSHRIIAGTQNLIVIQEELAPVVDDPFPTE
jgi:hypothetical protein